ncbi:MAG: GIY-YIG nuclease family protein [Alphaproteobacteria bacterium]|nr:GIY-YIG nuclease family protein [Alphaproteobacteria bacterium]
MKEFKEYNFWVYIMFNERAQATYIGMTNDLERRVMEHKLGLIKGNSQEHNTKKLGYYEWFQYVDKAIDREKALKKWKRAWKYRLIETMNPEWKDLAAELDEILPKEGMTEEFFRKLDCGEIIVKGL